MNKFSYTIGQIINYKGKQVEILSVGWCVLSVLIDGKAKTIFKPTFKFS